MTIERVNRFPWNLHWWLEPYSLAEYFQASEFTKAFWRKSPRAWLMRKWGVPVCLVGVTRTSLLGTGIEFWFLCCQALRENLRESVRFFRRALRLFRRYYPSLKVTVSDDFAGGIKFVNLLGFRVTPVVRSIDNKSFHVFELKGCS